MQTALANRYVRNVTRGCYVKLNQALHAVEVCAAVWVEIGVSIRDLTTATLHEAIAARNEQAKRQKRERVLADVELPGVVYQPSLSAAAFYPKERGLALQANYFADVAVYGEQPAR